MTRVNHVTFAVNDLDAALAFYVEVLGLRPVARWRKAAYLRAGSTWIALVQDARRSPDPSADYGHLAFEAGAEGYEAVAGRIRASGATVWQENTSEGASLYFLDPSGNKLELHATRLEDRMAWLEAHPPEGFVRY
jgi:catechol 2,3-dioxygenase-like lactoylglutathione lyase family enzyme